MFGGQERVFGGQERVFEGRKECLGRGKGVWGKERVFGGEERVFGPIMLERLLGPEFYPPGDLNFKQAEAMNTHQPSQIKERQ